MSDGIEEVVEPVEEVTPPVEPVETPDHDIRPPWVDELVEKIEAIPDAIAAAVPIPVQPEVPGVDEDEDGSDDSPVSVPWTHKLPFRN